ncbi:MAG: hypothetical protein RLZZ396_20 [Planctomycetota bacterium]
MTDKSPPVKPRLWTMFLVFFITTLSYLFVSIVATIIGISSLGIDLRSKPVSGAALMDKFTDHPAALALSIVPGHTIIILIIAIAAMVSSFSFRDRLSLKKANWPIWVSVCAVFASPVLATLTSLVVAQFFEVNEYQEMMSRMARSSVRGIGLALTVACISLIPAFSEEWLFRGYLQSRLAQRINPVMAILLSSLFFAAFHLSPVHSLIIFPTGLWLGFISYRCGSIIPAMIGHAYNNAMSALFALNQDRAESFGNIMLGVGVLGLLVVVFYSIKYPSMIPKLEDIDPPGPADLS